MTFAAATGSVYSGSFKKTFKILPYDFLNGIDWTTFENKAITYEKAGARPFDTMTITDKNSRTLRPGTDYTVSYKNSGTADAPSRTAVLSGKGNYAGKKTISFPVDKASLTKKQESGQITIEVAPVLYQKNKPDTYKYAPSIKVREGKSVLSKGKDYTVEYFGNTQAECRTWLESLEKPNALENSENPENPKVNAPYVVIKAAESGNYITGNDNTGNDNGIRVPLPIYSTPLTSGTVYVSVAEAVYTGAQVKPAVEVYYGSKSDVSKAAKAKTPEERTAALENLEKLKAGDDYNFSYGANISAGKNKGSVSISGTSPNYGGVVTVKFTIQSKKMT